MSEKHSIEICCSACGQDALLLREPAYDGFTRIGETLKCASCGHEYASEEEVPFKHAQTAQVFTDADRSHAPEVFADGEAGNLCRYCKSYVVNPFMQWCGTHKKEVQATDSCDQFLPMPEPQGGDDDSEAQKKPSPF